jgi:hypothetical protein
MKPGENELEAALRANAALCVRDSDDEIGNAAVGATTFQRALEQVGPISSSRVMLLS